MNLYEDPGEVVGEFIKNLIWRVETLKKRCNLLEERVNALAMRPDAYQPDAYWYKNARYVPTSSGTATNSINFTTVWK